MEKLCLRLIILFLIPISLSSQTVKELCVFASKGKVVNNRTGKLILKGDIILNKDELVLGNETSITVIDSEGAAYLKNTKGNFTFEELLKEKQKLSNLTVRYFQFLYKELTGQQKKQSIMAGVYRGNDLLHMPPNSAIISNRNLKFVWDNSSADFFYFFLKNKSTKEVLKIGVIGNEIKFYENMYFFKSSTQFEWTVDTREFPDLENIGWNKFEIVKNDVIEKQMLKNKKIKNDLEKLDFSYLDIKLNFCFYKGICY